MPDKEKLTTYDLASIAKQWMIEQDIPEDQRAEFMQEFMAEKGIPEQDVFDLIAKWAKKLGMEAKDLLKAMFEHKGWGFLIMSLVGEGMIRVGWKCYGTAARDIGLVGLAHEAVGDGLLGQITVGVGGAAALIDSASACITGRDLFSALKDVREDLKDTAGIPNTVLGDETAKEELEPPEGVEEPPSVTVPKARANEFRVRVEQIIPSYARFLTANGYKAVAKDIPPYLQDEGYAALRARTGDLWAQVSPHTHHLAYAVLQWGARRHIANARIKEIIDSPVLNVDKTDGIVGFAMQDLLGEAFADDGAVIAILNALRTMADNHQESYVTAMRALIQAAVADFST